MKVLIDTNILIDFFAHRPDFFEYAKSVIQACLFTVDGYVAAHSVTNIFYVLHETLKIPEETCRNNINKICQVFKIISVGKDEIFNANNNLDFHDFEDSVQNQCAEISNVDYIVTRNVKDFEKSKIEALTPIEFLKKLK